MIGAHVIGGSFMIIRLSTKLLATKHIPPPKLYIAAIPFGALGCFQRTIL